MVCVEAHAGDMNIVLRAWRVVCAGLVIVVVLLLVIVDEVLLCVVLSRRTCHGFRDEVNERHPRTVAV